MRWSLETLGGEVVEKGEETAAAEPQADTQVRVLDLTAHVNDENSRKLIFVAELWQADQLVATAVSTFVPNKHLELADPQLRATVRTAGEGLAVDVSSATLARHVELAFDGVDAVFSDNYFDIPAGRTRTITAALPAGWSVAQAQAALQVRSLRDSYV